MAFLYSWTVERPDRTGGLLPKVFDLGTLAFLAAILGRILSDPTRINHDSASLLMGAVMVHEGRMPIAALFAAMNPPVVSYANVLVVETAAAIGTNVIFVYLLATWAAVAVSSQLKMSVVDQHLSFDGTAGIDILFRVI